jgi:predicted O-linked N-acetylglucosamine transferase (SPINDLY family)
VDVALDPFPYHGTTTTCEALWMGVPVISLQGDRHACRVGASLLHAVGHPEWIANDENAYVTIARQLAANPSALSATRAALRGEMQRSVLLDHAGQSSRFAAALRACWQEYCAAPAA